MWVRPGVHTDMSRDGSFFVLSLGYPRVFTLQKTSAKPPAATDIVWEKPLASGSALKVSAVDNRSLYHAVHPQPALSAPRPWRTVGSDAIRAPLGPSHKNPL